MTIYVDQMFLENFIMNFIILYITSRFSSISGKWYRLAISASIGATFVIFSYIFGFYDNPLITLKIFLAIFMVVTAFNVKSLMDFFKVFITFLGVTFLIGGASFGLAFLFNFTIINEGGVLYVEEFPVEMIVLGGAVSVIIIKWCMVFFKGKINLDELIYEIEIRIFDKTLKTIAFFDSGHSVTEPITGYPVIIIERGILKEILLDGIFEKVERNDFSFEEKWKKRIRFIPISTVDSGQDILIGFLVDECVLYRKDGNKYMQKVIVAGCEKQLNKDGKYHALIGEKNM